jgi:hypothetical protein
VKLPSKWHARAEGKSIRKFGKREKIVRLRRAEGKDQTNIPGNLGAIG